MRKTVLIEACVSTVDDALAAELGGADRLEVNMALDLDGLTPSLGLVRSIKQVCSLPIIAMIRPNTGGFCYTHTAFQVMREDIDLFLREDVAGFAFGILNENQEIDIARTQLLVEQIGKKEAVFHRAFDLVPSQLEALEQVIACGITRVLSSGQKARASDGIEQLASLVSCSRSRIEILPGSGICADNVASLLAKTGCRQVHGTFKGALQNREGASSSGLHRLRRPAPPGTDERVVAEVRRIVDGLDAD